MEEATRLGLHGNGKTQAEIAVALTHHVGHLVLDSLEEVELAARAVRAGHVARLWLNDAVGQVLANGLDLLGVSAPERM